MGQNKGDFKLIRVARLVDGKGGSAIERSAVLLENDKIRAFGGEEDVIAPEGAHVEEYNYEDKTLLPGLVDGHVHLTGMGDGRSGDDLSLLPDEILTLQAARNARAHLHSGVTTTRDCGGKNQTTFMLRTAMDMGITIGPKLVLCGRPLSIIGGHMGYFGEEVTGIDSCRAAVRQLIKEGADYIKVTATGGSTRTSFKLRPSFSLEELKAICSETHNFGKHIVAHCTSTQGIVNALDAGVDTIVHAIFTEPDGANLFRPDVAERIAKQGVFINPTLHIKNSHILALKKKSKIVDLDHHELTNLSNEQRDYEHMQYCFNKMRELGVRMICGSDSAWKYYPMGSMQHELEAHVEAGMSPMEAIVSATSESAASCKVNDTVGVIEKGMDADLLIVDGNPDVDIKSMWNVVDVFQRGSLINRDSEV